MCGNRRDLDIAALSPEVADLRGSVETRREISVLQVSRKQRIVRPKDCRIYCTAYFIKHLWLYRTPGRAGLAITHRALPIFSLLFQVPPCGFPVVSQHRKNRESALFFAPAFSDDWHPGGK